VRFWIGWLSGCRRYKVEVWIGMTMGGVAIGINMVNCFGVVVLWNEWWLEVVGVVCVMYKRAKKLFTHYLCSGRGLVL
jgi:hypothetical protein